VSVKCLENAMFLVTFVTKDPMITIFLCSQVSEYGKFKSNISKKIENIEAALKQVFKY
jgi:hypothetical protein